MAPAVLKDVKPKTVSTLNPFSGPGSLKADRQQRRRAQFKIAVWGLVGANVVFFAGMLIQGCRGEPAETEPASGAAAVAAPDTNGTAVAAQASETNAPVPPPFEPVPTNTVAETGATPAPAPAPTTTRAYTVVAGDSFYKIARANGVSLKALQAANPGVDSAKLKVGQVVQLPAGAEPGSTISSAAPTSASPAHRTTAAPRKAGSRYVVKSGDTLDRIARKHGTTVQAIKATNGLTSDRIAAGQTLTLPEPKAAAVARAQG